MDVTSLFILAALIGILSLIGIIRPQLFWELESRLVTKGPKLPSHDRNFRIAGGVGLILAVAMSLFALVSSTALNTVARQQELFDSLQFSYANSQISIKNNYAKTINLSLKDCTSPVGITDQVVSAPGVILASKIKPLALATSLQPDASAAFTVEFTNSSVPQDVDFISCKQLELTAEGGVKIAKESTIPGLNIVKFIVR